MDTTTLAIAVGIVSFITFLLVILTGISTFLFFQFRKTQGKVGDVSVAVQNLLPLIQQEQIQGVALNEKVSHLEPVTQTISSVQVELKGLVEKVVAVQQYQSVVDQNIATLGIGLAQTGATITSKVSDAEQQSVNSLHQEGSGLRYEISRVQQESGTALAELKALTNSLTETTGSIRAELARAKNDLTELQTSTKVRLEIEQQTFDSIRRLEAIIAGTKSKGIAGENIVEGIFARLPIEWQVRNFQVGGKPVEFGLKLPNDLILPIDSKWAATNLLEQFSGTDDPSEQQRLKGDIEGAVIQKAKEVRKYIDPNVTVPFAIAVVPRRNLRPMLWYTSRCFSVECCSG